MGVEDLDVVGFVEGLGGGWGGWIVEEEDFVIDYGRGVVFVGRGDVWEGRGGWGGGFFFVFWFGRRGGERNVGEVLGFVVGGFFNGDGRDVGVGVFGFRGGGFDGFGFDGVVIGLGFVCGKGDGVDVVVVVVVEDVDGVVDDVGCVVWFWKRWELKFFLGVFYDVVVVVVKGRVFDGGEWWGEGVEEFCCVMFEEFEWVYDVWLSWFL